MSDLINRTVAIDLLDNQIEQCDKALGSFDISREDEYAIKVERASLTAYKEELEYLPSAQPEIIRCGECRHCSECEIFGGKIILCKRREYDSMYTEPDAFCSYAERKEQDDG